MRYFFLLLLHYSGFNQDDEAAVRRASRFTEKLAIFATLYLNHMFCDLNLRNRKPFMQKMLPLVEAFTKNYILRIAIYKTVVFWFIPKK